MVPLHLFIDTAFYPLYLFNFIQSEDNIPQLLVVKPVAALMVLKFVPSG